MRGLLAIWLAGVALALPAAPSGGEEARAARGRWTWERTESFRGKAAVDAEAADARFTPACSGSSNFIAAFQLARDGRFVFARVTLRRGRFVRGKLERFGLPDVTLAAKDWDELCQSTPMAITLTGADKAPVCLLAPKDRPRTFRNERRNGDAVNPAAYLFSGLDGQVGALGVGRAPCRYEVSLTPPRGQRQVLATLAPGQSLGPGELCAALRKMLGRNASDREVLDLYYSSTVTYKALKN